MAARTLGPVRPRRRKVRADQTTTAIALAFEGPGDGDGMIEWARQNNKNMSAVCDSYMHN